MKIQRSTLHNITVFLLLVALILLACPAPIRAEEAKKAAADPASDTMWDGTVVVRTTANQRDSYKFLEYRTMPAAGVDSLNYYFESGAKDRAFSLKMSNLLRDDGRYDLGYDSYGKWKLELGYDNILHRFGYDVRTLYNGTGTGSLTISPVTKAPWLALAGRTNANFVNTANLTDPQLVRRTYSVGLDLFEDKPMNLRLDFSSEDRSGFRPMGLSISSVATDIMEPIAYTTNTFSAALDFANTRSFYGSIGWSSNQFTNRIGTVGVENPITNTAASTSPLTSVAALYPNNSANTLNLDMGLKNLFWKGRLTMHGSWSNLTQSGKLLPYTSNTFVAANTTLPDGTPGYLADTGSFNGNVSTDNLSFNWSARPRKNLSLSAKYYHYAWKNNSDVRHLYRLNADSTVENVGASAYLDETVAANWATDNFEFGAGLDLPSNSHLSIGYASKTYTRTKLANSIQTENGLRASFDTSPRDWFTFRANYEKLTRRGDYDYTVPHQYVMRTYGIPITSAPGRSIPTSRKFDQANRDRDVFNAEASFVASKYLNFGLSYSNVSNVYPDTEYGRTLDSYNILGADVELSPSDRCRMTAYYTSELYKLNQKGHVYDAANGNPFNSRAGQPLYYNFDWGTNNTDLTNTWGANVWANLKPDKLDLNIDYQSSTTVGKIDFPKAVRTSGVDWQPAAFGNNDNVAYSTLNMELRWKLKKGNSFTLGWLNEYYLSDDWSNTGFVYVPVKNSAAPGDFNNMILNGGQLTPSYSANTFYFKYGFKI